jgi:hypothetical protein
MKEGADRGYLRSTGETDIKLKDIEVSSQKDGLFSRWKSEGIGLFI